MSDSKDAKLGFFITLGLLVSVGFTIFFIHQNRSRPSLKGVTYFDRPIGGLKTEGAVRYRGVDIGRIEGIYLDEATTYIRVEFAVWIDALPKWETEAIQKNIKDVDPLLRAQIATSGLVGAAFLQVDRLDNPQPALEIANLPTDRHYLPSQPSALTDIFRKGNVILDLIPEMIAQVQSLARTTEQTVQEVREAKVTENLSGLLVASQSAVSNVNKNQETFLGKDGQLEQLFLNLDATLKDLQAHLGPKGTVATVSSESQMLLKDLRRLTASDGPIVGLTENIDKVLTNAEIPRLSEQTHELTDSLTALTSDARDLIPQINKSLRRLRVTLQKLEEQPEQFLFGRKQSEEVKP